MISINIKPPKKEPIIKGMTTKEYQAQYRKQKGAEYYIEKQQELKRKKSVGFLILNTTHTFKFD